jgi:PAS domain S-box-containing protein
MEPSAAQFYDYFAHVRDPSQRHLVFRVILEACPDIIYLYDRTLERYLFVSGRSRDILGYAPEEVQRLTARDVELLIHPDDVDHARAHHAKRLADSEVSTITYRVRTALGDYRLLRCRHKAFSRAPDGAVKCILGVATDITGEARRQNEIDALRSRILAIRDEERQKIARRMHDTAMQHLVDAALILKGVECATSSADSMSLSIREARSSLSLALRDMLDLSQAPAGQNLSAKRSTGSEGFASLA